MATAVANLVETLAPKERDSPELTVRNNGVLYAVRAAQKTSFHAFTLDGPPHGYPRTQQLTDYPITCWFVYTGGVVQSFNPVV